MYIKNRLVNEKLNPRLLVVAKQVSSNNQRLFTVTLYGETWVLYDL